MMTPKEIAARRLAALESTPEADDLHWELTCEPWRRLRLRSDEDAAAELLAIAGGMLLAGQRLPLPLANWLAGAMVGAAREKTPIGRRAMLALRLGIIAPQRRPKHFDRAHLQKLVAAGMGQRAMAVEFDVDRKTLRKWLGKIRLGPADEANLLKGVSIVRKAFKKPHGTS